MPGYGSRPRSTASMMKSFTDENNVPYIPTFESQRSVHLTGRSTQLLRSCRMSVHDVCRVIGSSGRVVHDTIFMRG